MFLLPTLFFCCCVDENLPKTLKYAKIKDIPVIRSSDADDTITEPSLILIVPSPEKYPSIIPLIKSLGAV